MLQLIDYFAPLNISNLLILFLFVLSCEIIGFRIAKLFAKEIPNFLRGTVWLIGMGVVVFAYFLSHYFFPYSFPTILYILLILTIPVLKYYVETKGLKSLIVFLKNNYLPLIVVLLLLPQIFVKSSQPPYVWDEMSYHYISPYTLYFEKIWNTGSSFYQNLPRLLETAYVALFSLTKTYAVARLFHFSIFVTFLIASYSFLKKNFGLVVAITFFLLTIFYKENFLLWSTFGYVDIGTSSFVMIGIISLLDYVFNKKISSLQFSIAFFAMAVGSKYSALTQLISFFLITTVLLSKNKGWTIRNRKKLLAGLIMFVVLGGYWYIKNFVLTGNPIYPFLFGCRSGNCETMSLKYTIPLTLSNSSKIYARIFLNNVFLQRIFIIGTVLSLALGSKKAKQTVLFILLYVVIEIVLVKNISGFEARYFYHWQILSMMIIVIPLSIMVEANVPKLLQTNKKKGKSREN